MSIVDRIKSIFVKQVDDEKEKKQEEFDILLNDIDKCALYLKNREKPFVLIKDKNFPFMLNNPDLEFIEMNKQNFEYYGEFYRLELMNEKILELERQEELEKKTEDDYLIDFLQHSENDFSKVLEKMKLFEIDKIQYDNLICLIKSQVKTSVKYLYDNYKNANQTLKSDRAYKEIIDNLIDFESFTKKFPYKYYKEFRYNEKSISHCGYPDYMWQSGAERNIHTLGPNT